MNSIEQYPGIVRHLGAIAYDLLVVVGILFVATLLAMIASQVLQGSIEFGDHNLIFQAYLLCCMVNYYAYFWFKTGQTVGMRAWKIQLMASPDSSLSYLRCLHRVLWATLAFLPLGIGYWLPLLMRKKDFFHDRQTGTYLAIRT